MKLQTFRHSSKSFNLQCRLVAFINPWKVAPYRMASLSFPQLVKTAVSRAPHDKENIQQQKQ